MKREKVLNIDWDKMSKIATKRGLTMAGLSNKLGFDKTYLTHRKKAGWLWSNSLELIAHLIGTDYQTLLIRPEQLKSDKSEARTTEMDTYIIEQFGELKSMLSVQTKLINTLIDDLIVLHKEIKQCGGKQNEKPLLPLY